ncbi:MAG: putative acyl-CoA transferase/carnitine dehydratase [Mycobacterium sp.]|nr:putative acyl-CoA transferase/carnitine dehydratase [Mycobacterium sp.]
MIATDQAAPASDARPGPLNGVRVVDLTTFLSGPFCTQILADLGAEIVKVEPFGGDSSRSIPPHFVGDDSAYYLGNNRNKRSIALDLKSPEGLRIARELIARSDVVVENFRPGVCERLGLDVDALRAERPDLVWASISGFGQTGPWRDRPAYDMIVQALSGVMSLTGEVGRAPVRAGVPIGDLVAGLYAAIGVLAGLAERGRGVAGGRTIDVSMLDCQLAMLSYQAVYAMHSGTTPGPQGRAHDSIPTYRAFTAGDGRALVVTANTERMWAGLCHVLGLGHLVDEPRFADAGSRLTHRDDLWQQLEKAFLAEDAATWVDRLVERRVPCALIKTVPEALDDARETGRGMVLDLESEDGRRISVLGNPLLLVGDEPAAPEFPPVLGEHSDELLTGLLGMEPAQVARLHREGVVLGPDDRS